MKLSATSVRFGGLLRPLSTLSFSSSIAELAEYDCGPGINSGQTFEIESVSPTAEGFGDDILLSMRAHHYGQTRPIDQFVSYENENRPFRVESTPLPATNNGNGDWQWGNGDDRFSNLARI